MKKINKFLIVGLGNFGTKYQHTRHNVGFDAIDKFKNNLNIPNEKKKLSSIISVGQIDSNKLYIIKPQTYMNNSGIAVKRAMFFYRIKLENIIVIYDDMDIKLGKIRIRKKGSGGTHNGMKSIIAHIRSYDFNRIRIGIGKPEKKESTVNFVLGRAKGLNKREIDNAVNNAADAIESIISNGIDKAMQEYNK